MPVNKYVEQSLAARRSELMEQLKCNKLLVQEYETRKTEDWYVRQWTKQQVIIDAALLEQARIKTLHTTADECIARVESHNAGIQKALELLSSKPLIKRLERMVRELQKMEKELAAQGLTIEQYLAKALS